MICEYSWYSAQNLLNLKCQGKYETVATEFPFVGLEYWELRKWRRKRTHSCVFFWPGEVSPFPSTRGVQSDAVTVRWGRSSRMPSSCSAWALGAGRRVASSWKWCLFGRLRCLPGDSTLRWPHHSVSGSCFQLFLPPGAPHPFWAE